MISATLITLNEEENIGKALESLKGLVDEIIIVDSGSIDKTLEIAEKYGAKIYHRELDNFSSQKNWALSKAQGDWILSLDADEIISPDLKEEILAAVKTDDIVAYLIPRKNFILSKEIKYSRWSPDAHIWLWKKNSSKWVGEVHEEVIVDGKIGRLNNSKIHYSHKSISEFIHANNRYSELEAFGLSNQGIKFSFLKMIWQPQFEFIIRFFYKWGFLDGKEGFILAYLMGVYKLMVWIKLWEFNIKK